MIRVRWIRRVWYGDVASESRKGTAGVGRADNPAGGAVLELWRCRAEDELDPKGRAALKEALRESWAAARAGRMPPVEKLLEDLRSK